MKFGLRDEIYIRIEEITKKYKYKFVVFGSRARGDYKNNSDIDIAVLGNVSDEDFYKIQKDFDSIDMDYMLDIVFENKVENTELLENIKKEGILI